MATNPFGVIRETEVYTTKTIAELIGVKERTIRIQLHKAGIQPYPWSKGVWLVSGRKFLLGLHRLMDQLPDDEPCEGDV